jgi:hypothetical protein
VPVAGPYYFAWVNPGTAFDPDVHNVMDEYIFSYRRILREGDKPRLQLVIRNPHIGLLNSSRKQWAWFARDGADGIVPLFYGRLIAAPKDIFKELMTIDLVAWPLDYNAQRQKLAEEIKASGPYDPVFIEVSKRDDPDALLEAISGLYHVDPITHEVTISDIINGEDGNVDVTADHHLYDGMSAEFDQVNSLTAILMVATVQWNQTGQGTIDMGRQSIRTFAGDNVIAEWPKPLQSLGGGYTVFYANAADTGNVNGIVMASASGSYTNKEKEHSDGDCLSANWSITAPSGSLLPFTSAPLTSSNQVGLLDPFATDGNGDPSPTNIPPHAEATYAFIPGWLVTTSLVLSYRDLDRQRTERVQMLLKSDLQSVIVNPEVEQNSEVMTRSGADVGVPIVALLNWTTVAGQAVAEDVIVFPDNPLLPSQRTAQICVSAGTAGLTTPNFSDVPGATTTDGSVVWASLGTPAPTETAFDWPPNTKVGLGTIILPRKILTLTYAQVTLPGRQQIPQAGVTVSFGSIIRDSNGNYQACTLSGLTKVSLNGPAFSSSRGVVTHDGSVEWTCIGSKLPDGKTHYLCVQEGQTGPEFIIPQFDSALHGRTTDGSVIWASIGPGEIPAGGTPGDVWARSYFTTARGLRSIEYLVAVMRARARIKARAVAIGFTPVDPFGLGLQLTLRKTASLHDVRVGGGIATGKLTTIEHACDGHTGRETCRAQIGCAIGKDNVIAEVAGTPTYVDGYVDGYRATLEQIRVISDASDVGYTPPVFAVNDDGLEFPLTKSEIVISEGIRGDADGQGQGVGGVLATMAQQAQLGSIPAGSLEVSAGIQSQIRSMSGNSINTATALHPIWYDAVLKPLSGWQFNNSYNVALTNFTCPRGIDLEASSTP